MTQIVMKLATWPSEMSGLTLGSLLLDSAVMVMAHTSCTRDQYLDWNAGYSLDPVNAVIDYE